MTAAALATLSLASGCAAPPPAERRFPTLAEIAPAEPIRPPVQPAEERGVAVQATVTRIVLPLDVSIEPAWAQVNEDALPPLTRGVWRANGLRAGVLAGDALGAFLDGLPPVWSDRSFRVVNLDGPVLVRRSPPLVQPVFADLTVPPYAPRREPLLGHRAALLLGLESGRGATTLELTPLHQKPRATVVPRSASQKERDGRLFTELGLRLRVSEGSYAVIGLARDPAGLPTADEVQAAAIPTVVEDLPEPAPARFAPPPLPTHLGRALFTLPAERRGEPQVLLVVSPSAR